MLGGAHSSASYRARTRTSSPAPVYLGMSQFLPSCEGQFYWIQDSWLAVFFFFLSTLNQSAQPLTSKASERNLPMVLRVLPDKCSILPGTVYSLPVSQNPLPKVFTNQMCHFSARARTSADLMVERLSGNISTLVCWGVDLLKSPTLLLPGADNTQRHIQSLTIHFEKR